MKRHHLHRIAALLSAGCLIALAANLYEQRQAIRLNAALAAVSSSPGAAHQEEEDPRILLARGVALARIGDIGHARTQLQEGLQNSSGTLQDLARFNLGNLALRQALVLAAADDKRPALLALAKQQYRDTLLREPDHQAARYNLERALWLAPEDGIAEPGRDENNAETFQASRNSQDSGDQKERATTTMRNEGGGLP